MHLYQLITCFSTKVKKHGAFLDIRRRRTIFAQIEEYKKYVLVGNESNSMEIMQVKKGSLL